VENWTPLEPKHTDPRKIRNFRDLRKITLHQKVSSMLGSQLGRVGDVTQQ
jgi:hypothetical protein